MKRRLNLTDRMRLSNGFLAAQIQTSRLQNNVKRERVVPPPQEARLFGTVPCVRCHFDLLPVSVVDKSSEKLSHQSTESPFSLCFSGIY